jgi:phosphoglycolate phosphatase-like HAD superfamily hydrolase
MIRTVVFDFEGTLVDFQWQLGAAEAELRLAFAAQGYRVAGSYSRMWNAAADEALPRHRLGLLRAALGPVYDRWDADALARWSPRPGAQALLERLAARGVTAALVSNIGRTALAAGLQRCGLGYALAPVLSRDDVVHLKPHPEGVRAVLAMLGAAPAAALFVGDSLADVAAARAAGLQVAILRGGECDDAAFATAPPDHFVTSLAEVEALLDLPAAPAVNESA